MGGAAPPPYSKARTRFGLFHVWPQRQFWRAFADLPHERHPSRFRVFGPPWPLCSPFLSVCLASVREVTSCIDAGFRAASFGWKVVAAGDRNRKSHRIILSGHGLDVACVKKQTLKGWSTLKPAGRAIPVHRPMPTLYCRSATDCNGQACSRSMTNYCEWLLTECGYVLSGGFVFAGTWLPRQMRQSTPMSWTLNWL